MKYFEILKAALRQQTASKQASKKASQKHQQQIDFDGL